MLMSTGTFNYRVIFPYIYHNFRVIFPYICDNALYYKDDSCDVHVCNMENKKCIEPECNKFNQIIAINQLYMPSKRLKNLIFEGTKKSIMNKLFFQKGNQICSVNTSAQARTE